MMSFNDFIHEYKLKNEATSNIKIYEVLKKIGLNSKVGIYLRDGDFSTNYGIVNLHPSIGKITTSFEPSNDEDVINRAYLDEKLLKINSHLSLLEKIYNEFKLHYDKQSVEEILIQRTVKATIQILYDKFLMIVFLMQIRF